MKYSNASICGLLDDLHAEIICLYFEVKTCDLNHVFYRTRTTSVVVYECHLLAIVLSVLGLHFVLKNNPFKLL